MSCMQLKGQHTSTVLCISTNKNGTIATGGEDGELCLWNVDGAPLRKYNLTEDVSALYFSKKNPCRLYVGVSNKILVFDISKDIDTPENQFSFNEEEVNYITLNEKEEFLASCDDSGEVKIINLQENRVFKTLRKHTSICSCVLFRPKRTWELISSGLDCRVFRCDFSRGKSLQIFNMQEAAIDCELPGYMVNPPLVHTMDVSKTANLLACGLENGHIHVFDNSKKMLSLILVLKGHSVGVSQVHFPKVEGFEQCLVSGGNDSNVCIWDLSNRTPTAPELSAITPKRVISHGSKVNWIESTVMEQGPCVLVSDVTCNVSVYQLKS